MAKSARWEEDKVPLMYRDPNNGMAPLVHEDSCRVLLVPRQVAGPFWCRLLTGAKIICLSARTTSPVSTTERLRDRETTVTQSEFSPHPHPPQDLFMTKTICPACKAANWLCHGSSSARDLPPQPQPPPPKRSTIRAEPVPRPQHFFRQPRGGLTLQCACVDMVGSPRLLSAPASYEPTAA